MGEGQGRTKKLTFFFQEMSQELFQHFASPTPLDMRWVWLVSSSSGPDVVSFVRGNTPTHNPAIVKNGGQTPGYSCPANLVNHWS